MEYGIWNIHGGLWTANPLPFAGNGQTTFFTNAFPQAATFSPAQFIALKQPEPEGPQEDAQSDSEATEWSDHSNASETETGQTENKMAPDICNDNAVDAVSNYGFNLSGCTNLHQVKLENSLAFISQQLNPMYNLMLSHLTTRNDLNKTDPEVITHAATVDTNQSQSDKSTQQEEEEDGDDGEEEYEENNPEDGPCSTNQNNELFREISNELEKSHLEINGFVNANEGSNGSVGKRKAASLSLQRVRYEREEYRCTLCPYTCTIEKAFYRHLRAHSSPGDAPTDPPIRISCVVCGKDRSTEGDMGKHMKRHRDDRFFCCDICVFRTVQLKKLIQHRRMHTGERPHLCPHCAYRSARRDNLRSHVRRVHKRDNLICDTFRPRGLLLTPSPRVALAADTKTDEITT